MRPPAQINASLISCTRQRLTYSTTVRIVGRLNMLSNYLYLRSAAPEFPAPARAWTAMPSRGVLRRPQEPPDYGRHSYTCEHQAVIGVNPKLPPQLRTKKKTDLPDAAILAPKDTSHTFCLFATAQDCRRQLIRELRAFPGKRVATMSFHRL